MSDNPRIPFNFFHKTYHRYLPEYQNAFITSISNKYSTRLLDLEQQMIDYHSNKPIHSLIVKNSRDALSLICMAIGLKEGDEVLTSSINDIEIIQVLLMLNLKPILLEIKSSSFHLDPLDIPNRITDKTKAIIVSDIVGQVADYRKINNIISNANVGRKEPIIIIQDYRYAFGARRNNIRAGMHGTISYTSWKFSGIGEAAMCLTSNKEFGEKLRILRNGGSQIRNYYEYLGIESYPPQLMIELVLLYLKYWNIEHQKRKTIIQFYHQKLEAYQKNWKQSGPWKLMTFLNDEETEPNWEFYAIRIEKRQEFLAYLKERNIDSPVTLHRPLHMQPLMLRLGYRKGSFPIAEKISSEILFLPCDSELEEWQQYTWITSLKKFYNI
jgi:UDP-2-acetamido-2-deoxy-ribo-hexuluronate aminotransferase